MKLHIQCPNYSIRVDFEVSRRLIRIPMWCTLQIKDNQSIVQCSLPTQAVLTPMCTEMGWICWTARHVPLGYCKPLATSTASALLSVCVESIWTSSNRRMIFSLDRLEKTLLKGTMTDTKSSGSSVVQHIWSSTQKLHSRSPGTTKRNAIDTKVVHLSIGEAEDAPATKVNFSISTPWLLKNLSNWVKMDQPWPSLSARLKSVSHEAQLWKMSLSTSAKQLLRRTQGGQEDFKLDKNVSNQQVPFRLQLVCCLVFRSLSTWWYDVIRWPLTANSLADERLANRVSSQCVYNTVVNYLIASTNHKTSFRVSADNPTPGLGIPRSSVRLGKSTIVLFVWPPSLHFPDGSRLFRNPQPTPDASQMMSVTKRSKSTSNNFKLPWSSIV